jgi:hypothetical protein
MTMDYTDPKVWQQAQEMAGRHGSATPGGPPAGPSSGRRGGKVILFGCSAFLLLFVALVAGIVLFVFTAMRSNDAVKGALDRAGQDPRVVASLGQPVSAGYRISGTIHTAGEEGRADLEIPVSGPKGRGTLYLSAVKQQGTWQYRVLQLAVEGRATRIDLLPADKVY